MHAPHLRRKKGANSIPTILLSTQFVNRLSTILETFRLE